MRIVSLIAIVVLVSASVLGEDYSAYAGRSHAARKMNNDGLTYETKGDSLNARRCFDEAVRVDPTMWPAYVNRASLDIKEHKFHQAIDDATKALLQNSSFNRAATLRAEANLKLGNYASARRELDQLISLGGAGNAYDLALNDSAWLRATCPDPHFRNGQLALTQAALACRLTGERKPGFLDTLAAANAQEGNFDAAFRIEEKALTLRETSDEPKDLRDHLRKHMASFKQHRPWRDILN